MHVQSAHCAALPCENCPALHVAHVLASAHVDAPAAEAVPGGHVQSAHCASLPAENCPAVHGLHSLVALVAGEAAEALPFAQVHGEHVALPSFAEN